MDMMDRITCRRALEALRSGVPNKQAVELLGSSQPEAQARFSELLDRASSQDIPPSEGLGMLVAGNFGTGKSHLLSHLEHEALNRGFVASRIVISKETPLFDLNKVFKSAIDRGRIPNATGRLMEEIGLRINNKTSRAYDAFSRWVNSEESGLHQVFPATVLIHERLNEPESNDEIEQFWSGDQMPVARVREGLRRINQHQSYRFKAPTARELPPQRLRFATELIRGAGYKGWVVLLDEIELVGSYSLLQRAKSYAELARWLGRVSGEDYPGLIVVATVTDDFALHVLGGLKQDSAKAAQTLQSRNEPVLASRAETGMHILQHEARPLAEPSKEDVNAIMAKLRHIYSTAYSWDAPVTSVRAGGAGFVNRMRYKVRSAINEWDLLRLYPDAHPDIEETEFRHVYEENIDLEQEARDDS